MARGVPRIPEPREWVLTKRCPTCGETKPWAKFPPRVRWPDGSVRRVHAYCHECEAARIREWWRTKGSVVGLSEERAAYKREWERRRWRELRQEKANHIGMLPPEPFRSWLNAKIDEIGIGEVAAISDVQPRSLFRVATGESKNVSLSIVDRVLVAFGEHVDDFYPLEQAA